MRGVVAQTSSSGGQHAPRLDPGLALQPSSAALTINTPPTATGSARVQPRQNEPPMTTPTAQLDHPPKGGCCPRALPGGTPRGAGGEGRPGERFLDPRAPRSPPPQG